MNEPQNTRRAEIPTDAQDAAMCIAVLEIRRKQLEDGVKAARKLVKAELAEVDDWKEARRMEQDIRRETLETRKEIKALKQSAQLAIGNHAAAVALEDAAGKLEVCKTRLSVARANDGQALMPFMRLAE
jgi:hypothetical protein